MADVIRCEVSIPQLAVYSFRSQVRQYPEYGVPGISYFKGVVSPTVWADCLLMRDEYGVVVGILNHYPVANHWEAKGNVNVFVDPDFKRQGIGTALVRECIARWGPINWEQQRYTPEGAAFTEWFQTNGLLDGAHRGAAFHKPPPKG